jgi:hypothetical protein
MPVILFPVIVYKQKDCRYLKTRLVSAFNGRLRGIDLRIHGHKTHQTQCNGVAKTIILQLIVVETNIDR